MERLPRPTAVEAYYASAIFTGPHAQPVPQEYQSSAERAEIITRDVLDLYKSIDQFDVYMGTSIRSLSDVQRGEVLLNLLEEEGEKIIGRPLLVTAPWLLTSPNNREKGRLERWCIERSHTALIYDGGKDTLGKDMEDAMARIIHRKPVIRLIEDATRAEIAQNIHPLALVGSYEHAIGTHVVRDMAGAIRCLTALLLETPHTRTEMHGEWKQTFCTLCNSCIEERKQYDPPY